MTVLVEFLFPAPAARSTAAIFRWWEARRPQFNLVVGLTGVFSLGVTALLSSLPPDSLPLPPVFPVVLLYGVLANVCYSAGPLAEALLNRMWNRELLPPGPALFRTGLTFSVGLTLLPIFLMGLDWLRRVLMWLI